jgi:hypothetical protein
MAWRRKSHTALGTCKNNMITVSLHYHVTPKQHDNCVIALSCHTKTIALRSGMMCFAHNCFFVVSGSAILWHRALVLRPRCIGPTKGSNPNTIYLFVHSPILPSICPSVHVSVRSFILPCFLYLAINCEKTGIVCRFSHEVVILSDIIQVWILLTF